MTKKKKNKFKLMLNLRSRPIVVLFFSLVIFLLSIGYFFYKKGQTLSQLPGYNKEFNLTLENLVPNGAIVVNNDSDDSKETITYTTLLSKDQIIKFYTDYTTLQRWEFIDSQEFRNSEFTFKIEIEPENADSRLVTLTKTPRN